MGRKEEQRGKLVPSRTRSPFEKFSFVLYAQNGMKAELQLDVK